MERVLCGEGGIDREAQFQFAIELDEIQDQSTTIDAPNHVGRPV